nr:mitochondrial inner membrane protease subunit 2 [Quercus suber]
MAVFTYLASGLRISARLLIPPVVVTSVVITINDQFFEMTQITGNSMAPTISPTFDTTQQCDLIGSRKNLPAQNLRRGEVILFANPMRPETNAIKRVVALEGDMVVLDPRRRPYSNRTEDGECPQSKGWDAWRGKVVVPEGHVWVEGDNWRSSVDSNWYGPLSKSLISGKAISIILPTERFGLTPWKDWKGGKTKVIPGHFDTKGLWALDQV